MAWTEYSLILQPSCIGGVGVFTTHDIPEGTQLFKGDHTLRTLNPKDIPKPFLKYCIFLNDLECLCPERFDRMEVGWYINHSNEPNTTRSETKHLITNRNIKAGEEILMDYNELNEPEHLKEDYFKT
jgi:hypothetical protein